TEVLHASLMCSKRRFRAKAILPATLSLRPTSTSDRRSASVCCSGQSKKVQPSCAFGSASAPGLPQCAPRESTTRPRQRRKRLFSCSRKSIARRKQDNSLPRIHLESGTPSVKKIGESC